jgi:signal peptidase II
MSATPKEQAAFPTIIGIAAVVFGLDQASKFLVTQYIPMGGSWSIIPAFERLVKFTFITNTGAAFGLLPQLGDVFTVVAVVVIFGIIFFHRQFPTGNLWVRMSLGLLLGGVMGNFVDRLFRGYVVDFVDIGFWPIFNLADASIVIGICILTYHLWDLDKATG